MLYRNNADLGKGVPRWHVFHGTWELLFFLSLVTVVCAHLLASPSNPARHRRLFSGVLRRFERSGSAYASQSLLPLARCGLDAGAAGLNLSVNGMDYFRPQYLDIVDNWTVFKRK